MALREQLAARWRIVRARIAEASTPDTTSERPDAAEHAAGRPVGPASQVIGHGKSPQRDVPEAPAGSSTDTRATVPWAYDLAAAWAWRFLVIAAAGLAILWTVRFFAVITFPLIIALFLAALSSPLVNGLVRLHVPRKLAALVVVLLGIAGVSLLLTFVGQQIASSFDQLADQVVSGLDEIREWVRDGPLNASDSQINDVIGQVQDWLREQGNTQDIVGRVTEVGVALSHILAGLFIVLFATYFFLADGKVIWAWVVRLFPRAGRERADASGRVAWRSLTQFVRATVIVAATDALGVVLVTWILDVPLKSAIGVLVFLGAFVPMIGAFLSGTVAVLVALVAHGPIVALLMLGGVVVVQQIESHVLQPFLMGRWVSVHPLGVIVAIAAGVLVAGIAGALVAVPLVAALNSVVQYLAGHTDVGEDPAEPAITDPGPDPGLAADLAGDDS